MSGRSVEARIPTVPAVRDAATARWSARALVGAGSAGSASTLRRGEILGVGGLAGQGQRELFLALFGAERAAGGAVEVGGQPRPADPPAARTRSGPGIGIAYVPEDRKAEGCCCRMRVRDNMALPTLDGVSPRGLRPAGRRAGRYGTSWTSCVRTAATGASRSVRCRGGNQQKVLIGPLAADRRRGAAAVRRHAGRGRRDEARHLRARRRPRRAGQGGPDATPARPRRSRTSATGCW